MTDSATRARGWIPGYIVVNLKVDWITVPPPLEQGGPEVLDGDGQPVWFLPRGEGQVLRTAGLRPETYQGRPVLTWWEGEENAAAVSVY